MELKMAFLLITVSVTNLLANPTYSQTAKVSLDLENKSLEQVMDEIERQSEFYFIFNQKQVDVGRKVSIQSENQLITAILPELFRGTNVNYVVLDRKILLTTEPLENRLVSLATDDELQLKRITGTVTDKNGAPLPGVNVFITGTSQGTSTDMAGKYSIEVPAGANSLTFSYVGMEPQEVAIGVLTEINVTMVESAFGLEEVVVVGYGAVKKTDLTGSVSSVSKLAIKDRKLTTVNQALMGQMAGVNVEMNNALPGSKTSIRVRGTGSITAGNEPLYVIDGFPATQNEANQILPSDIESINVLKDASSTAIYGSRGAGGVVVITTKMGTKTTKPNIQLDVSSGFASVAKSDYYELLNAQEYADYMLAFKNEQWVRDGNDPSVPIGNRPLNYQVPDAVTNRDKNVDTDWQDAVFEPALVQNYALSVSGGTEKTRYFYSIGSTSDNGVVIGSNFTKLTARLRLESDLIKDRLKVGLTASSSYSKQRLAYTDAGDTYSSVIGTALFMPPIIPIYNADGTYGDMYNKTGLPGYGGSPVQLANEYDNQTKTYANLVTGYVDLSITKGLSFKSTFGTVFNNSANEYFLPSTCWRPFDPPPTYADGSASYGNTLNWLSESFLTYTKSFGLHKIDVIGGFSAQKNRATSNYLYSNKYPNDLVQTLNVATITSGNSNVSEWSMLSYLVRANYSFSDKYLLTATIRRDGSSRFGADVRYGTFPSIAAAWRVSQESFMADVSAISNLKIRASYGMAGNNEIGNYSSIGLVGKTNHTFGLGSGSNYLGIYPTSLSNPMLSWEKSKQFDIGVDLGLFDERVSLVFDFYDRHTSDLLLSVNLPTTTGFSSSLQNIGEVLNRGVEFSITTRNTVGEFGWSTNFNIAYNHNEVLKLGPGGKPVYDFYGSRITEIGQEIGSTNGLMMIGILTQADINAGVAIAPGEQAGDPKYLDANKDGVISGFNGPDGINVGNSLSDWVGGLTNMFTYKNFDLSILITGQAGGMSTDLLGQGMWTPIGGNIYKFWWENRYIDDAHPGDGETPRITFDKGGEPDTRFISKTDFIRIQNLTLGYTIPLKKSSALTGFRAFVGIENLITFSDYKGYNPQSKRDAQRATYGGFSSGGSYPMPRTILFGLNASF